MAFQGWSDDAIAFYEGLEADNSRTYWQAHKSVYDDQVLRPMEALLAELAPEFGTGKVFRPYRDLRFSSDKSPYKTAIAASLDRGGYIQLSADGLGAGSGRYHLAPDQLDRYRRAVDDERTGTELVGIITVAMQGGVEVASHDMLKTTPKGYSKDHPRVDLLRRKGLVYWRQWSPGGWLETAEARSRVVGLLRAAVPLNDWLAHHVGDSTVEAPMPGPRSR